MSVHGSGRSEDQVKALFCPQRLGCGKRPRADGSEDGDKAPCPRRPYNQLNLCSRWEAGAPLICRAQRDGLEVASTAAGVSDGACNALSVAYDWLLQMESCRLARRAQEARACVAACLPPSPPAGLFQGLEERLPPRRPRRRPRRAQAAGLLVSVQDRGTITVWQPDVDGLESTHFRRMRTVKSPPCRLAAAADVGGGRVACAGAGRTLRIWDALSGAEVMRFQTGCGKVLCA